MTDSNGRFQCLNIADNKIKIIVRKNKYYQIDTSLNLDNRDTHLITLILKPNTYADSSKKLWLGYSSERAEEDIKHNYYRILLKSGLLLNKLPGDEDFEKKYGLIFYNSCMYIDMESMTKYNKVIFKYLDMKFGQKWRKEIRKDLAGL